MLGHIYYICKGKLFSQVVIDKHFENKEELSPEQTNFPSFSSKELDFVSRLVNRPAASSLLFRVSLFEFLSPLAAVFNKGKLNIVVILCHHRIS